MGKLINLAFFFLLGSTSHADEQSCRSHLISKQVLKIENGALIFSFPVPFSISGDFIPEVPYPTKTLGMSIPMGQCAGLDTCDVKALRVTKISINGLVGSVTANYKSKLALVNQKEVMKVTLQRVDGSQKIRILNIDCE